MTRVVIRDKDGVLVDTGKFHFRAWRRIFQEHGREITEGEFLESFSYNSGLFSGAANRYTSFLLHPTSLATRAEASLCDRPDAIARWRAFLTSLSSLVSGVS